MIQITAKVDDQRIADIANALHLIGSERLPNTAKAVQQSVTMFKQEWVRLARSAFKRPTGGYLWGIESGGIYPYNDDPYQGAVFNAVPYADWIENGTPPHDMKKALWISSKVRLSKKGKRYLIIPFRHGTPGSVTMKPMPVAVHEAAKGLSFSRVLDANVVRSEVQGIRRQSWGRAIRQVSAQYAGRTKSMSTGARFNAVMQAYKNMPHGGSMNTKVKYQYNWGQRLVGFGDLDRKMKATAIHGRNGKFIHANPAWKTSPYEGMVKFPRSEGEPGGKYMTFRVMHEDSKGWFHPGTPAYKLASKTSQKMQTIIPHIINAGFQRDMKMLRLM